MLRQDYYYYYAFNGGICECVCVEGCFKITSLPNGATQKFIGQEAEWKNDRAQGDGRH